MKNNKAVTLVALIITIIILLILAGVVIAMTIGDEGIINKSQQAVEKTLISEGKEKIELAIADLMMEKTANKEEITKENLSKINSSEISVGSTDKFPVEVMYKDYKYYINEKYEVIYSEGIINEDTQYKINNEILEFAKVVKVGEKEDCKTITQALDYLLANNYKENGAIVLKEGSYDTKDLHTGTSCNINPKYNGMSVSIIADNPGKTFMTSGEMWMSENPGSCFIELKFYRIIFKLPIYSDAKPSTDGFHLGGDVSTNEYYNCVFLPPVGGHNYFVKDAKVNTYNCLFMGGANYYYNNQPLKGIAQNCASKDTAISPAQGTKTTCLTNVTVDENYNITSGGWQHAGTGQNPDGTRANIGIYGGKYAW